MNVMSPLDMKLSRGLSTYHHHHLSLSLSLIFPLSLSLRAILKGEGTIKRRAGTREWKEGVR